ncbi:MAG: carboxypeptidase-like regulatory domain-containing protein [Bacteroidetes bacterium]|nr:carboxypeptidase-like regulatory domain-containing protein [Bacteroidota bacterium]
MVNGKWLMVNGERFARRIIRHYQLAIHQSPLESPFRYILILLAFFTAFFFSNAAAAQDRRVYEDISIRQVIDEIQESSPYRFLYRDALITGKTVSFEAPADGLIAALSEALHPHRLRLQVDETRYQIVLSRMQDASPERPAVLTGQVIDDRSGARLPFATITWKEQERLRGVAANAAGTFHLPLDAALDPLDHVVLTASYVGYRPRHVRVDGQNLPATLPIRLTPEQFFGHEVVVSSTVLDADLDTTWHHLLRPGLFSPLGESSVLRSLQSLPSVSLSTAFTQGLNVRGSKADGFQILLDGIPIYNQNHFFGLFDAFNEDALQTVGFYYGVTPAYFQAPPGGTLSFMTRTGSQTDTRLTTGLSNTALKATLEGPLWGGRGSWLVSGRHSYLNAIDWFNNDGLIAQGLDVGRETSTPTRPGIGPDQRRAFFPGTSSARFYDLHGKLYLESSSGNRLMANLYLGGDHTLHREARRLVNIEPDSTVRAEFQPVETRNTWGNTAASLHDQRALGSNVYGHTIVAFSRYHSRFSKDDFVYPPARAPETPEPAQPPSDSTPRLAPFEHNNELLEIKLAQHIDVAPRFGGTVSTGYALHRFAIDYEEHSALREDYFETRRSVQFDLFTQYDGTILEGIDLHAGLRSHYFSNGRFLRLSPRLRLRLWPQRPVSLGLGYSRNYQFLHRLYLEHENSSDVWVMSTEDQGPGSVDNLTAGLYVKASPTLFFQAEAYVKAYENLRQHESLVARRGGRPESLLQTPWLHDFTGRARGLELMLRHRIGALLWTHSYTLSKMTIRHEAINDGEAFPADWDRRHQFTTHVQGALLPHLNWHLTWLIASGTPNSLAFADLDEPATLPTYHRMDVGLQYRRAFRGVRLEATASVFNIYDRDNTWYRSPVAVFDPGQANRRVSFVNVDVYDLGFQPSFSLSFTF